MSIHGPRRWGLPSGIAACLFDLDGVLCDTATLHAAAWKTTFDDFLARIPGAAHFDGGDDYLRYVDGRPRLAGVRTFLAARGLSLPEGGPADPVDTDTVYTLGARKTALFLDRARSAGVTVYPDAVGYVRRVSAGGLRCAVVTSSEHGVEILERAGITGLFPVVVDGVTARRKSLRGKPAPDTFQEAARLLGVVAGQAAVFEDAISGVMAAAAGGFGYVVGVDRRSRHELYSYGADIVVPDLAALLRDAGGAAAT